MGNWRTINMVGTCSKEDLPALKKEVCVGEDWEKFHCLAFTGTSLCGLHNWPAENINAIGNLSERDYGVDDIVEVLEKIVKIVPSLYLKINVGGDYESLDCIATILCEKQKIAVTSPEIKKINKISQEQMQNNLIAAMKEKKNV